MSSKTASVKLTLESSSYIGGMRRVGDATAAAAKTSSRAWDAARAGLDGMKRSGSAMLGQLKSIAGMAVTLGGALSAGALMKDAIKLNGAYRDLAFRLSRAKGAAVDWREVQKSIEPIALKTSRTAEELAGAFSQVFGDVGDAKFAEASIGAIGTLATASGRPVDELAKIAGALGDKFGVTAEQIPDALSAMLEFGNRGGVQMEDLTAVLNLTGASARAAGLMGEQGFRRMIAMANMGGDALGSLKKGLSAVSGLVDQLAAPETAKALKLSFGVDTRDAKGRVKEVGTVLEEVMKKTKGRREKLAKVFSGEQLKLVTELGKPFKETYESMKGTEKEKLAAASAAFKSALDKAGETSFTFAQAQKEAAARAQDDPTVKYREALQRLAMAAGQPQIIEAFNKLAKDLPRIAETIGKVVTWISNNPALAAGGYAAGRIGLGGAQAALGAAFRGGGAPAAAGAPGVPATPGVAPVAGGGAAAAVATGAAAVGVALAADQAEKLRKETGFKSSILDLLPGMKGGSFSAEQLLRDSIGIGMFEKTTDMGDEAAKKLMLPELKRSVAKTAFEGSVSMADAANRGTFGPEGQRLLEAQGRNQITLSPEVATGIGQQFKSALQSGTVKVEVTNMPGGVPGTQGGQSGSRGSLTTPGIKPGWKGPDFEP